MGLFLCELIVYKCNYVIYLFKPKFKTMNYKQYQLNYELASAIVDELNEWSMCEDLHFEAIDREDNDARLMQKMQMRQCEDVIKILCKQLLNNLDGVD